jgi:hypothetical protein
MRERNWHFAGFCLPNCTMIPDELFDELLPHLSGPELKLLLCIMRRTLGCKTDAAAIPFAELLQATGLARPTAAAALRALAHKRIVFIEQAPGANIYRLHIAGGS